MKILLILPYHRYPEYPSYLSITDMPAGMAYIASALKKAGHEVIGLNLNNTTHFKTAYMAVANLITEALTEHQPDLVGLGGICTDYTFLKDAIGVIRNRFQVPIVLGGNIVTKDYEFIMNDLKPDLCVIGEGEETIVKVVDALENDAPIPDNVGYWDGKAIFTNISYEYGDINEREFPDYGVFNGLTDYPQATRILYRYTRTHPKPMTIITARSCPFSCTFCIHKGGPKYRARSLDNIFAEIKELQDKYEFNVLIVSDELFAVNKKRMEAFCRRLIAEKKKHGWDFDWMFQTHASAKLDEETLALAKQSGCYLFSYGIESASPKVLKSMNKHTKIEMVEQAIELAEKVGIGFAGNLIFGDPVEDEGTIRESMDFYSKYGPNNQIFLSILQPYPGSTLFDRCVEAGLIADRKVYYENCGKQLYNMTAMPNNVFQAYVGFFGVMENLWYNVPQTYGTVEEDGCEMGYPVGKIKCDCPMCGKHLEYRLLWNNSISFIGMGCHECNRRIKITLSA